MTVPLTSHKQGSAGQGPLQQVTGFAKCMRPASRSQMHSRRLNHDACRRCVVRVRVSVVALRMNSPVEAQRRKKPVPQRAQSPTVESTVKFKGLRCTVDATDSPIPHPRVNGQVQRSELQSGSPSSPTPTPTSCPSSPTTLHSQSTQFPTPVALILHLHRNR